MNKPKFRAWDKNDKKMIDWEYLINYCDIDYLFGGYDGGFGKEGPKSYEYPIPMQYTGLKGYMDEAFNDPEEKEVAQGDVIDIFWEEWPAGYYQENHMIGVVDWDDTGTAWVIRNGKFDWDNPTPIPNEIDGMSISRSLPDEEDLEEVFLHNFNLTSDDITILGNIHENPELLNEVE
ncbi:hypothetical protein CI088_15545 [Enterococcus plantarum]|uniref:YopX protein domain-containing protein n=1 Tax=Enterococcus plantarum TaxID=1077675 RepID=A0A2W4BEN0_9ENTE|nr:YopX family protein [Enterococcus plantarum]PZL70329.1 hypothetical protein CI088_15545 [Enterococcus plantarum]